MGGVLARVNLALVYRLCLRLRRAMLHSFTLRATFLRSSQTVLATSNMQLLFAECQLRYFLLPIFVTFP